MNIVDSNGVSVTKASDNYDIITLRVQYNSSKNFPVSFRTAKDCYFSSGGNKYFSTNGYGEPTSADNYDLHVSFENGESSMPQMEVNGYSDTITHFMAFYDVTATALQLTINGGTDPISFSSAYVYEDNGLLYIVYKKV